MERLIKAFRNSLRAFSTLIRTEKAFQQEVGLLVIALPVAWIVASDCSGFALLIASILILVLVEVLNTAIEAACNATSREFNVDIQLAKDCGSLAVLISIMLALGVWGVAVYDWLMG